MRARASKFAEKLAVFPIYTPSDSPPLRPEWLRVEDAVRVFGISRSKLYQLFNERKIKTFCLRQRNKLKGVRLINFDSLHAFMESEAAAQEAEHQVNKNE
jgi:Helix-turn-helix domain